MKKQLMALAMGLLVTVTTQAQQWTTSGTNIYNSNTGNVGIGNTAPLSKFQINTSSTVTSYGSMGYPEIGLLLKNASATNNNYNLITFSDANNVGISMIAAQVKDHAAHTGALSFFTRKNAAAVTPQMTLDENGNLGIGTATPFLQSRLHIKALAANPWGIIAEASSNDKVVGISHDGTQGVIGTGWLSAGGASPIQFQTNSLARMTILTNGNIGIGTAIPDQLLTVKGIVHAQEVRIDLTVPGPDYVFGDNYKLLSLFEIKSYIDQHKHLPDVPSAAELEKNGIAVGEMNMVLLKKVEELTLYVIELKKESEELKTRLEKIENVK